MGSFNTTCFVSQQTIGPEDAAIIIPIMQQATYDPVDLVFSTHEGTKEVSKYGYCNSGCYPTAFWNYAGPIIKGVYDDYGQFNLIDSKENKQNLISFFNSLEKKICNVKQGENTVHDIPLNFGDLYDSKKEYQFSELVSIWNEIWKVGQEARLFMLNYKNEPMPMAFAVMHQCVADYLLEGISKASYSSGESLEPKSYFHTYANKNIASKLKYFERKEELGDMVDFFIEDIGRLHNFRLGEGEGESMGRYYKVSNDVVEKLTNYAKQNSGSTNITKEFSDELFEEFKSQIEHRYLATTLSWHSIKLAPMVYGGQDYENDSGNGYLKLIRESNKRVKQMLKDRNEKKPKFRY